MTLRLKPFALAGAAAAVMGYLVAAQLSTLGAAPSAPRPAAAPATVPVARPKAVPAPVPPKAAPAPEPAGYVVKRVLPIDGPMKFGSFVWDEAGVPQGPLVVTVDLKAQTMSVFRDGYEIGASVILYGSDAKPTPTGVYPITQKKVHHVSNIYGAEMPYMQRLTDDGITIHASNVRPGYATHGCIGLPLEFARKLFGATKVGDKVIVTNGEMLKQGQAIGAAG